MSNYFQAKQRLINSRISPSKRSNGQNLDHNMSLNSNYYQQRSSQEYEALIQFELARQKQKTKIYQQRLKNKQIFIQQMKQYQDELARAFQNCQRQLQLTKKRLTQIQDTEIRTHLEEIAELKHLVIRLEDQINKYERNSFQQNVTKQYNSVKNKHKKEGFKMGSPAKRKERSKTLMHNQEDTPKIIDFQNTLEGQVIQFSRKIANFVSHFLGMAQLYQKQVNKGNLKTRLRLAWRWIKNVVKQWHFYQKQVEQYREFVECLKKAGNINQNEQLQDVKLQVCHILRNS